MVCDIHTAQRMLQDVRRTNFFSVGRVRLATVEPYRIRRRIGPFFLLAVVFTLISWYFKGQLVEPGGVDPTLLQEPLQTTTSREEFAFEYKDKQCRVQPVADFELWGLVVSHNNIHSVADIYHDSTSVDTKDLCVIWGENLERDDYRRVEYKSGPWTCYISYPDGVHFAHDAIGNNHLIAASSLVRDRIGDVRIGDQIRLSGLLVNYQMSDWESFWRRTSTRRDDYDCEVVFVEKLDVVRRGTPGWYAAYRAGWIAILALPVFYLFLMWIEAGRSDTTTLGRLE